jgi:flagella basal body P-ring formation protein FlgA
MHAFFQSFRKGFPFILLFAVSHIGHAEATFVGPQQTMTLTQEDLAERIAFMLADEYRTIEGEFQVEFLRPQETITVPDGVVEVALRSPLSGGLRSRVLLRYEVKVNDQSVYSADMPAEVRVMRDVLVSNRRLSRKERLTSDDVNLERWDILKLRDEPIDPATDISAFQVHYSAMKGTILTQRHVRLIPVVSRGDIVIGQLQRGLLEINLQVEVVEEAAPGQTVRVRNIKSRKLLTGIVSNENTILLP